MIPTKDQIKELQRKINSALAPHFPLSVDGGLGKMTRGGLAFFQSTVGLPITGDLDDRTAALLLPAAPGTPKPIKSSRPMDPITKARIALLHPRLIPIVTQVVEETNALLTGRAQMRITDGLRTIEQQDALFAQGRSKPGPIVTKARGGQSYHNYGLAIDACLLIDGKEVTWDRTRDFDEDHIPDFMEMVTVCKKHGAKWGASFGDYPHFEWSFGLDEKELLAMYKAGKKDSAGYVHLA